MGADDVVRLTIAAELARADEGRIKKAEAERAYEEWSRLLRESQQEAPAIPGMTAAVGRLFGSFRFGEDRTVRYLVDNDKAIAARMLMYRGEMRRRDFKKMVGGLSSVANEALEGLARVEYRKNLPHKRDVKTMVWTGPTMVQIVANLPLEQSDKRVTITWDDVFTFWERKASDGDVEAEPWMTLMTEVDRARRSR